MKIGVSLVVLFNIALCLMDKHVLLYVFSFEGHIEICPPGMSHSTYSVNKSVLEAIKARLASFHELLLEPPKVSKSYSRIENEVMSHSSSIKDMHAIFEVDTGLPCIDYQFASLCLQ